MIQRVHPLTGEPQKAKAVNGSGPRFDASMIAPVTHNRRANLTYDSARDGTDLDGHWAFADARDSDSANSAQVRHKLMRRSRYEVGSNGFYAGIVATHCNMVVGTGPTLRMTTKSREFNQLVEREWFKFCQAIQFRRKLWCMCHARTADGEAFGVLKNNPALPDVQLDLMLIEAEQCQTPFLPFGEIGYIDGIKHDLIGNVEWYDILPQHPGATLFRQFIYAKPIRVAPQYVLHWFKLERPGAHRGKPDLTSTLNVGASARRHREATIAAAETAADIGALLTTQSNPSGDAEPDPAAPFSSVEFAKRMLTMAPMGWDVSQLKGEHPNAQYAEFHRTLLSEQARPLSMPYNAAACDSSTYSFASGKLDTLCYRAALDVERQDCNDLVLDPFFAEWFKEWTIVAADKVFTPEHQWDWPLHPVIDAQAEAAATDVKLKNGTITQRQVFSDNGQDLEDQLVVMAEDWFGEATDQTIAKARQINLLRNVSQHALPYVAQIMGLAPVQPSTPNGAPAHEPAPVA